MELHLVKTRQKRKPEHKILCSGMELVVRIELTTCSLRMSCSAIEPHQQGDEIVRWEPEQTGRSALLPLTDCYYTIKLGENQEEISDFMKNF